MMPRNPIKPAQIDLLDLTTSVFISYRREDSSMWGITVGAAVAWDPALEHLKLVLPWRDLGQHGTWTLTRKAAEGVLVWYQTRSIEPVLKPELSPES
jgi:hypothetical protein